MEISNEVKEAQIALREAEINQQIKNEAKLIAELGRCGRHRNHFDIGSFIVGALVILIPIGLIIILHGSK